MAPITQLFKQQVAEIIKINKYKLKYIQISVEGISLIEKCIKIQQVDASAKSVMSDFNHKISKMDYHFVDAALKTPFTDVFNFLQNTGGLIFQGL